MKLIRISDLSLTLVGKFLVDLLVVDVESSLSKYVPKLKQLCDHMINLILD